MELMVAVIERALIGAEALQPAERADLFEGIAQLANSSLPEIASQAAATADALREAETRQMTFAALLRPNPEKHEPQNTRHHE